MRPVQNGQQSGRRAPPPNTVSEIVRGVDQEVPSLEPGAPRSLDEQAASSSPLSKIDNKYTLSKMDNRCNKRDLTRDVRASAELLTRP
jgi:hypothetical protein